MKLHLATRLTVLTVVAMLPLTVAYSADDASAGPAAKAKNGATDAIRHTRDRHPDLSGTWTFATDLPHGVLVKVTDGKATRSHYDQTARHHIANEISGALPWDKAPSYKAEYQDKVKFLFDNESKVDPVFYCGKPGTPRIGSPRKIVQLSKETIFFYEDSSGDTFRIIPTDGRPHRADANPSAYGDSIGHWEGAVFVVESTNFLDDTWFGENGYMHSDKMRVLERLWLTPEGNLAYQATVDDPVVLAKPWTNFPHVIPPSNDPIEESAPCKEVDGQKLINLDHHLQR